MDHSAPLQGWEEEHGREREIRVHKDPDSWMFRKPRLIDLMLEIVYMCG